MADSSQNPWSSNPNAPKIPHLQYLAEKENFIGNLAGSIFYGFVVVLFFRCMGALLNPIDRTRGIKWGLVAHTSLMFSFVTINTAMSLDIQSVSYIDKRKFPSEEGLPPGPFGYQLFLYSKAISFVTTLMFFLNNWLADGLLLYRCHVIYSMNYWVIAFPCLMYVASLGAVMGIMLVYQSSRPESNIWNHVAIFDFGVPSYWISLALNVLLTLMVVIRLVLHNRRIRKAMGTPTTTGGMYNTLVTMLIESSAIYAVSFLLYIGPWSAGNNVANIFSPILTGTQVIAPFLIILRVANRTALTNDVITAENVGSMHFISPGKSSSGSETLSVGDTMSSVGVHGETPEEFGIEIEEVPS